MNLSLFVSIKRPTFAGIHCHGIQVLNISRLDFFLFSRFLSVCSGLVINI